MVSKKAAPEAPQTEEMELDDFINSLSERHPDSLVLQENGQYFAAESTGKLTFAETKNGGALILHVTYLKGNVQVKDDAGNQRPAVKGETYGFWLSAKVLQDQVTKMKPQAGEIIGVVHRGKRKSASGYEYNDISFGIKDRPAAETVVISWERAEDIGKRIQEIKDNRASQQTGQIPAQQNRSENPPF